MGFQKLRSNRMIFAVVGLILMSGCAPTGSPENAVLSYLDVLIQRDDIGAINHSCLAWEENARAEALSFDAVEVRMEGVDCSEVGEQEDVVFVQCQGQIIANYGGEDQDIDLSEQVFRTVLEDGEWKMCGYGR